MQDTGLTDFHSVEKFEILHLNLIETLQSHYSDCSREYRSNKAVQINPLR